MGQAETQAQRVRRAILELVRARGVGKTCCPSEVARQLEPEQWRDWIQPVRAVSCALVDEGALVVTQKGNVVDARQARGAIRLGLPKGQDEG
ncbi:MAG: DUF3253 domain-containing protein [Opitutales bacterium]